MIFKAQIIFGEGFSQVLARWLALDEMVHCLI